MSSKRNILFWIKKICDFLRSQKFKIDPLPKIIIDEIRVNDDGDIFIETGKYDVRQNTIYLFVNNRHLKDVLRSFCHEIVHHHQALLENNRMIRINTNTDVASNEELKEIEKEAYLLGNLYFRNFTEQMSKELEK